MLGKFSLIHCLRGNGFQHSFFEESIFPPVDLYTVNETVNDSMEIKKQLAYYWIPHQKDLKRYLQTNVYCSLPHNNTNQEAEAS